MSQTNPHYRERLPACNKMPHLAKLKAAAEYAPPPPMELSFAGCGFLCIYHAGVCAAIKEYAPQLTQNRIRGSSAGAIAAAGLVCNVCMSHATSTILQCVTEARAGSLQALSPNFDILSLVRHGLEESLPENAHILCTGRLLISATRARDYANVVISEFCSREELIQAILCSCFIPFYCGRTPPTYRGEHYIDGGFSDNQPGKLNPGTVTVSPFSGESDICPSDEDSASLFGFDFCGSSIQFTTQNLFRMVVILFPPSPEVCSRICRQGFDDALRFLTKNNLVPCVKCLTVQSNAIPVSGQATLTKSASEQWPGQPIRVLRRRRALIVPGRPIVHECERCMGPLDKFEPVRFSGVPLPSVVQKSLAEMEARSSSSWLNWLRRWRLIRWWLRLVAPPVLLPFELAQFSLKKIRAWLKLTALAPTETYLLRFQKIVDFLLQEVENRRPSAALPIGPPSSVRLTASAAPHQGPSAVILPPPTPQRKLSIAQRKISTSMAPLDLAIPDERLNEFGEEEQQRTKAQREEESKRALQQFCERHDAVLAFSYMDDESNQLKICQIFDTDGRHPRLQCHTANLETPLEYLGQEEEAAQTEEHDDAARGEDSGLSLEEEEGGGRHSEQSRRDLTQRAKKDACCSPVRHLAGPPLAKPAATRRHTFSSRSARLSGASSRTLSSAAATNAHHRSAAAIRFVAPGSRLYASNSMNALKTVDAAGVVKNVPRRKISMQPASSAHQRLSSNSDSADEEEEKARVVASNRRQRKASGKRAQPSS